MRALARLLLGVAVLAGTAAALPAPALAQAADDWGVKRNPFDRRVVDRWRAIVERDPNDRAALRRLWDLYVRYSKPDTLIAEYEARQRANETAKLALLLGRLYELRPDAEKAAAAFTRAAELAPDDPSGDLARAPLLLAAQDKAGAAEAYARALPRIPGAKERRPVLKALADLRMEAGDLDAARGLYEQYFQLEPSDGAGRLELAEALAKHGEHELALAEYRDAARALGKDPGRRLEAELRAGVELEALGRDDEAVKTYRDAEARAPRGHHLRRELVDHLIATFRKRQALRELAAQLEQAWAPGARGFLEWEKLAELHDETGEQEKALEAYRRAVAVAPGELDTQRRLIGLLERAGKDAEVIRAYEALIRVAPGEPRFRIDLAERLYKHGDKARALALLGDVGTVFPDDAGVHAALADLYSRWGEDARALREYERLVRIEPGDEGHLVALGEQHYQRGDKAKAMVEWRRIAAPRTPEVYARLGEVYAEHDLGAEAIEMYQKALALRPRAAPLWAGLAGVLERQRQDDKAVEAWEKVMELLAGEPASKAARRDARARIVAILYRKRASELPARTADWVRRFRARPPDLEAGYLAVESYLRRGMPVEAQGILESLLKVDPQDLDARRQLVNVLKSQRKLAEAVALLKELLVAEPANERQVSSEIAELELQLYHDDDAIAYAQRALEKAPDDPQALLRLADIHAKRSEVGKAIAAYRRVLELDPRNFAARFALAKLYLREGQHRDAARLYREVFERAADEEVVRAAARKAMDLEEYLQTLGDLEQDVAPLAFAQAGKSTYRRILVEIYDRYVPPLVVRARAGDAAAAKELQRLGEHGMKPLLEALEDSGDAEQLHAAVRVLGYLGNRAAAAPLVRLAAQVTPTPGPGARAELGQPALDLDTRVEALVAAGRLADPRVLPELARLLGNKEAALREAAAWAAGQTRSPKALEPLLAALGDPRPTVHALACIGLGRLADRRGLDRVAEVMRDPTRSVEARAACAYALGTARSTAHLAALAEVVGAGNDDLQVKAAWALGRLGDARAAPALLAAYWLRKPVVREAILWALARLSGAPDVPPRFEDVTLDGGRIDLRALLAGLVGELPAGPVDPGLVRAHAAPVAAAIAEGLADQGRRDLVLRILRDLDGPDPAGPLALGPLDDAGSAALEPVRVAVGRACARPVSALTTHRDPEVRALALSVAGKLGDPDATARLAGAVADEIPAVRLAALAAARRALARGGAGSAELVAAVARRVAAPAWTERSAALLALGAADAGPEAVLVAGLKDPSGFVREAAARALGLHARPASLEALLAASHDEAGPVRAAVARTLKQLGLPAARARLAEMAADPDPAVRAEAR